jgi:hypothetical protein
MDTTLADRAVIASLQDAYGIAVDRRNWDLFRELFTTDIVAEYPKGTFNGIDHWVEEFIAIHLRYTTTAHSMTNHMADVDGDRATASCYGVITLARPDGFIIDSRTFYEDQLTRAGGRWRIAKRRCHRQFWRVTPMGDEDVVGPMLDGGAAGWLTA